MSSGGKHPHRMEASRAITREDVSTGESGIPVSCAAAHGMRPLPDLYLSPPNAAFFEENAVSAVMSRCYPESRHRCSHACEFPATCLAQLVHPYRRPRCSLGRISRPITRLRLRTEHSASRGRDSTTPTHNCPFAAPVKRILAPACANCTARFVLDLNRYAGEHRDLRRIVVYKMHKKYLLCRFAV